MAEIWKPFERIVYINWLDMVIAEAVLTDWEKKFIEDMELILKYQPHRPITEWQAKKLEQIYASKTS